MGTGASKEEGGPGGFGTSPSRRKKKLWTGEVGAFLRCVAVFQLVARPDVVEMHDVTAQDPKLLVHLKATRNSVPVPRHWCFKRKYLQGKRGIEKPPFELPDFIKRTGIQEMREALQEKVRACPGPGVPCGGHVPTRGLLQNWDLVPKTHLLKNCLIIRSLV